jgi:hypothetical protein
LWKKVFSREVITKNCKSSGWNAPGIIRHSFFATLPCHL